MDCAPIVGLSDSLILATLSDVNLITVSYKKTKLENLEKVKKLFDQANIKIHGVVLNNVKTSKSNYYNYYSEGYYTENDK